MAANEHPAWYATAAEFAPERKSGWAMTSGPAEQTSDENSQSTKAQAAKAQPQEAGVFRQIMESLACLAVAVIVFRAFLLEGYIISTGSMAPSLLGYHKQVVCPDCKYEFAFGVAFDRPTLAPSQLATCPNCGQGPIALTKVPRNDGDQLLVNKYAYLFGDPHRWEVVVFLNPNNPNQAYVKRVVGLPGETIYVRDGDVYIDGRIQRKTMAEQRAIRIPVFDQKFQASGVNWIPRWLTDPEWTTQDAAFAFNNAGSSGLAASNRDLSPGESLQTSDSQQLRSLSWVRYFHWPRLSPYVTQGGRASLESLRPSAISDNYGYNQPVRISEKYRVNDLMLATRLDFSGRSAEIASEDTSGDAPVDVQRLASANAPLAERGTFVARLSCRKKQIVCRIDADARVLELWIVGSLAGEADRVLSDRQKADATVQLKKEWFHKIIEFELSSFDRQATVAMNGVELATVPLDDELRDVPNGTWSESPEGDLSKINVAGYASNSTLHASERRPSNDDSDGRDSDGGVQQAAWTGGVASGRAGFADELSLEPSSDESLSPVAFGARRGSVTVESVMLYRDVHYTTENHRHATERPLKLGDDEFFFLGDNSPVSLDSRGWVNPVVSKHLLVGRPLVVHLPSQPGRIKIGSTVKYIRIPDFSKIRCIR
jgi:signal peptidase I